MSSVHSCKYPLFYVFKIVPVFRSTHRSSSLQGLELSAVVELVIAVGFLLVSALGQKHLLVCQVRHWGFRWTRMRRNSEPLGVLTTYDQGSSHFLVTFAGLHTLDRVSYMATVCPGIGSCRSLATFLSCWSFCTCWWCCICSMSLSLVAERCSRPLEGSCVLYILWLRSFAGAGSLLSTGVVRYASSPRQGSSPDASAFLSISFTVWTILSLNPLLLGYASELVVCSMPQLLQFNALNSLLSYCGPLSVMIASVMPYSANTDLRWFMTATDVVELSFLTMGNLL